MAERLVLDASVALAWFLKDTPENNAYALSVFDYLVDVGAVCLVPALFDIEVGSRLIRERRNRAARFSAPKLAAALEKLDALSVEVHHPPLTAAGVVQLAERYHLQGYDAIYFHLAKSLNLPIASIDAGIRAACRAQSVKLLTFN